MKSDETLWGLFVNAGYLTIQEESGNGIFARSVLKIPNEEVKQEFVSLTESYLDLWQNMLTELIGALIEGDMDEFLSFYRNVLKTASYYDLQNENSYHLMVLGMTVCLSDQYEILSEKESGKGRADLILKASEKNFPSFIFDSSIPQKMQKIWSICL